MRQPRGYVNLDRKTYERLCEIGKKEGESRAALVRRFVKHYKGE